MHNSKLYSILEHFNKYEQNRCRKYIQSPYFNKNETLLLIFEALIKDINKEKKKEFTKEVFWKRISSAPYDDVRFRKHLSDLLKLVEGFLSQEIYENTPLYKATFLIDAVGDKKLEKLYNSTRKSARRLLEKESDRSANFYYSNYKIEKNFYELSQYEHNRSSKSNMEEITHNLDKFYLSEKLRFYCAVKSQKYVSSHQYNLSLIDEIINHVKIHKYEDTPAISIYYQILLTHMDEENDEDYFKLKKLLELHGLKFAREEAMQLYGPALNYCIRKINEGEQKFLNELFDLYKDLLVKEILIVEGELSPWDYKNITTVGLRLGEYEWCEEFIQTYQFYLPESSRENAVSFNLATLYFYQKKYENVIPLLQTVEFEDFTYNLGSKAMLLATYYETDEMEPLYSLFESFRAFLNRHKDIPRQRRSNYSNLIKFTKKLTKIMPGDEKAISKIKSELDINRNVASIGWLKEKIAELE